MKKYQLVTGINLIAAIVLVNVILNFYPFWRIDLTRAKIHSLSPATVKITKNLNDLVNIKVFLTQDLPPAVRPVMSDLKTVLEEIARLNQSKIKVTYLDPNKDQGAATEARNYGIQALQFSSVKSDKFEVQTGYFGLALVYGEKSEVLPVASDVGNLEYFLMSAIKRLSSDKIPAVALADENSSETQILRGVLGKSYKFSSAAI